MILSVGAVTKDDKNEVETVLIELLKQGCLLQRANRSDIHDIEFDYSTDELFALPMCRGLQMLSTRAMCEIY